MVAKLGTCLGILKHVGLLPGRKLEFHGVEKWKITENEISEERGQ